MLRIARILYKKKDTSPDELSVVPRFEVGCLSFNLVHKGLKSLIVSTAFLNVGNGAENILHNPLDGRSAVLELSVKYEIHRPTGTMTASSILQLVEAWRTFLEC